MTARAAVSGSFLVQYAPSGRSGCLECKHLIQKGELRLGAPLPETGRWQWRHWDCLTDAELGTVRQHVQRRGPKGLTGREELSAEDQERVRSCLEGSVSGAAGGNEQPVAAAEGATTGRGAAAAQAAAEKTATEEYEEEEEQEAEEQLKKQREEESDDEEEEDSDEVSEEEPAPRIKTPRKSATGPQAGRRLPSRRMAEKRRMAGDDEGDSDYDPRGAMSGSRAVSPASSRAATPHAARTPNWRNPTVTGARSLCLQLATLGRGSVQRLQAHDSEAEEGGDGVLTPRPRPQTAWELVVALAALSVVICYADRSNISTAILPMADQYGWATGQQGLILSQFFLGYLLTQLLGGALADRYGGKGVLTAGVAAWSVCTVLTPPAASLGIPALIAMRIAMGLGEGVAFPAIHSIIARSVPTENQSTAVGIVTAASYGGTALAFGLSPAIIEHLGWPWVFYIFGTAAVLWLPPWSLLRIDGGRGGGGGKGFNLLALFSSEEGRGGASPLSRLPPSMSADSLGEGARLQPPLPQPSDAASLISEAETEWSDGVAAGYKAAQRAGGARGTGFWALIRTKEVWAICAAQYAGSWGFYGLLNWLPSFFRDAYNVEIAQLASFTLLPFLVQGGMGAASGLLADKLLQRGWPVKRVRRTMQTVGMLGPAACMLAAASPLTDGNPGAASAWVTVGLGLNALTLAAVSVSHLDVAPKHAGVVFATGNTCATLAGLLAVPLTGVVLETTHSWPLVFAITAGHYVVGAALFATWVGDRPLPQDG